MQAKPLSLLQIKKIYQQFAKFRVSVQQPIVKYRFKIPLRTSALYLTIYHTRRIIIQGSIEAKEQFWEKTHTFWKQIQWIDWYSNPSIINNLEQKINHEELIWGGDESGKGDVFGSIHLTLVKNSSRLNIMARKLHLQDSKKMSDQKILWLGPKLLKICKAEQSCYYIKITPSQIINKNLNLVLAQHYLKLILQIKDDYPIVIDAFCSGQKLREYWGEKTPSKKKITVKQKGESYFNAIAIASIISRYHFLHELQTWQKLFSLVDEIPKGANKITQKIAKAYLVKNPRMAKFIKINYIKV